MFKIEGGVLVSYTEKEGITNVAIPRDVTSIGDYVFYDCTSLTSVTIPDSVMSIGTHAFSNCKSLTSITIPDSVTSIGKYAFSYCKSLTNVTIPNSVTSIGYKAFYKCTSLTSITIPDSVTNIGSHAFEDCTSLTSIIISNSVTSIGKWMFAGCTSLKSITTGNGVTSINNAAFYQCEKLISKKAIYKAFEFQAGKLKCRELEYREGEWSKEIKDILICQRGYHFCDNLFAIFNYYAGEIDKEIVIYECEVGDKIKTDGIKYVTNKIKPVKRLYRKDIIKILNNIN